MINNLEKRHTQNAGYVSQWSSEEHMVTALVNAGSSHCCDSCKCRAGVAENIWTRRNIYACLFIYALQAHIVKGLLWTHSLRWGVMFTQLGSVLFLIRGPHGVCACSCWTRSTVSVVFTCVELACWQTTCGKGPRWALSTRLHRPTSSTWGKSEPTNRGRRHSDVSQSAVGVHISSRLHWFAKFEQITEIKNHK